MEMTGGGGETQQQRNNGRMGAELETRAMRLELEKAEKERRIQVGKQKKTASQLFKKFRSCWMRKCASKCNGQRRGEHWMFVSEC
jgi:hypothetical protein